MNAKATAAEIKMQLADARDEMIAIRTIHKDAVHRFEWVPEVVAAESRVKRLERAFQDAQRAELDAAAAAYRQTGRLPAGFCVSHQARNSTGTGLWDEE